MRGNIVANKIILSRKGFDSANGGMASPIFPDGRLVSIPIPEDPKKKTEDFSVRYSDLQVDGQTFREIIDQLHPNQKNQDDYCHLDPDIFVDIKDREKDWEPCFGQSTAALSHLDSQKVNIGDIFLFFGWYKQTEVVKGKIKFKRGARNQQIIFGYLQVKDIARANKVEKFIWHPHSKGHETGSNAIYVADKHLLNTDLPGYGTFRLSKDLVLTKEGLTRSKWELPECMKDAEMTYHGSYSKKEGYFQSAMIGQEFVFNSTPEIEEWILSLVEKNRVELQ